MIFFRLLMLSALLTSCQPLEEISASTHDGLIPISKAEQLYLMEENLRGNFILTNDIELQEDFTPIGSLLTPFKGSLQGNGHTISNLRVTPNLLPQEDLDDVNFFAGLFAINEGEIKNLKLEKVDINININYNHSKPIKVYLGGLCGKNSGIIDNVEVNGNVTGTHLGGKLRIGLIAGKNVHQIVASSARGTLNGRVDDDNLRLGGIAGEINSQSGSIINCLADTKISGLSSSSGNLFIGGITGVLESGKIDYCEARGELEGIGKGSKAKVYLGGITGFIGHETVYNDLSIFHSASFVKITGESKSILYGGGITGDFIQSNKGGRLTSIIIAYCYFAGQIELTNLSTNPFIYGNQGNGLSIIECYPDITIEEVIANW